MIDLNIEYHAPTQTLIGYYGDKKVTYYHISESQWNQVVSRDFTGVNSSFKWMNDYNIIVDGFKLE